MTPFPQGNQPACRAVSPGGDEWHVPSSKRQNGGTGAQHPSLCCSCFSVLAPPPPLPSLAYFLSSSALLCLPLLTCLPACLWPAPHLNPEPHDLQHLSCCSGQPASAQASCSPEMEEPSPGWVCQREEGMSSGLQPLAAGAWSCNLPRPSAPQPQPPFPLCGQAPGCTWGQSGVCPRGAPGGGKEAVPWSRVTIRAAVTAHIPSRLRDGEAGLGPFLFSRVRVKGMLSRTCLCGPACPAWLCLAVRSPCVPVTAVHVGSPLPRTPRAAAALSLCAGGGHDAGAGDHQG